MVTTNENLPDKKRRGIVKKKHSQKVGLSRISIFH
jgi:hypothetical protein